MVLSGQSNFIKTGVLSRFSWRKATSSGEDGRLPEPRKGRGEGRIWEGGGYVGARGRSMMYQSISHLGLLYADRIETFRSWYYRLNFASTGFKTRPPPSGLDVYNL